MQQTEEIQCDCFPQQEQKQGKQQQLRKKRQIHPHHQILPCDDSFIQRRCTPYRHQTAEQQKNPEQMLISDHLEKRTDDKKTCQTEGCASENNRRQNTEIPIQVFRADNIQFLEKHDVCELIDQNGNGKPAEAEGINRHNLIPQQP